MIATTVSAESGARTQPEAMQVIGAEHIKAAGVAEDADARPSRARHAMRKGRSSVDEILQALRLHDAKLGTERVIELRRAGKRSGMRGRGAGSIRAAAGLQENNGLALVAGPPGGGAEPADIANTLDVAGDHPDPVVLRHMRDRIGELETCFVAGAHEVADAEFAGHAFRGNESSDQAALRYDPDWPRSWLPLRECRRGN